jgi:guanine deaminase
MGIENQHSRWVKEAVTLAVQNVQSGHGGPFGALVVRGDELIASGVNEVTRLRDPTAHAEVMAIRAACQKLGSFQLTGCALYCSCEPCPMCLGAIYWARPQGYYFACTRESAAEAGFDDDFIYSELHLKPESRTIPGHCMTSDRSTAPFVEWAQSIHRIRY